MLYSKVFSPFIVTLTPSRCVGIWLFRKSDACQVRESPTGARAKPDIATHVFGAVVVLPPSALTTDETTGASTGVLPIIRVAGLLITLPSEFLTWTENSAPLSANAVDGVV